jgi:hypothetical protein
MMISVESDKPCFCSSETIIPTELSTNSISWSSESLGVPIEERLSRLAFTAPAVFEAICQGRQPAELGAEALLESIDLSPE